MIDEKKIAYWEYYFKKNYKLKTAQAELMEIIRLAKNQMLLEKAAYKESDCQSDYCSTSLNKTPASVLAAWDAKSYAPSVVEQFTERLAKEHERECDKLILEKYARESRSENLFWEY